MLGRVGRAVCQLNQMGIARFRGGGFPALLYRPYSYAALEDLDHSSTSADKDQTAILASTPKPLSLDSNSRHRVNDPPPKGLTGVALKILGFYSRESQLIRGTRTLYSRITAQVERPELYASFLLEKTFRTTHAMLLLHMWLCLVRLRAEGKEGAKVGQALYEVFNHDLEQRIVGAGVKMLVSKWMKELEKNFYGAVAAYDKAMQPSAKQDELAHALWRNIFAEDDSIMPTGPKGALVKSFARYIRREAACLALTDSASMLSGNILFSVDFGVPSSEPPPNPFQEKSIEPATA